MPATKETINTELFNTLKSRGYEPAARSAGDQKASISDADLFVFKFIKGNQSFGPARVAIDEKNNLVLYTNERLEDSPQSKSKGSDFDDSWNGLKNYLRKWSRTHGLKGFKLVRDGYLQSDMAMRKDMKNNKLNEGYYAMGKKLSYSDSIPSVKILIQHTRQIEEGEQRYRNINKIFVENVNGERFLLPTKRPGVAKVYARHIAEGGTPYDERGKHITSLVEEYTKMAGFVRATKNGVFTESAQRLVNEGVSHYQNLRETLSSMISTRGYNKYFDNYTPVLNEESEDATTLNELFVEETIDPRIESVMPILKRLSKNINEMSEVKALEEWAETITEVEDETTKTLAEPASEMLDEEGELDEIGIGTLKSTQRQAAERAEKFEKEIERIKRKLNVPGHLQNVQSQTWNDEEKENQKELLKKYELAAKHYRKLASKVEFHPSKMDNIKTAQKMTAILPAKMKNVAEAPGAETLAHNQDTEEKNLKAFGLAEGFADTENAADEVMQSMGGVGKLTINDIRDAVIDLQQNMDDPYKLDVEAVVDTVKDRLSKKGMNIADTNEGLDANQKRAGQLGPTESVGPEGAVGKLVGASESVESDELNRIKEMIGYK